MVWYSIVEGPMRRAFRQCGAVTDGGGFGKRDTGSVAGLSSQIDSVLSLSRLPIGLSCYYHLQRH